MININQIKLHFTIEFWLNATLFTIKALQYQHNIKDVHFFIRKVLFMHYRIQYSHHAEGGGYNLI